MAETDLDNVLIKLGGSNNDKNNSGNNYSGNNGNNKGNNDYDGNFAVQVIFFVIVLLTLGGLVSALANNYAVIMTSNEGVTSITNCRIPSAAAAALSLKPLYGYTPSLKMSPCVGSGMASPERSCRYFFTFLTGTLVS